MGTLGFVNICHPDYADETAVELGAQAADALADQGIHLRNAGVVVDHRGALIAARSFLRGEVDGVVVFYGAFVLSSTVMALLCELPGKPLLFWGVPMIERDGLLRTTGSYVAFSMFSGTLHRLGIRHEGLIAEPRSDLAVRRVAQFAAAGEAARRLRRTRLGLFGYTAMSIYPGTVDHVLLRHRIGPEIEHFDSYTLIRRAEAVEDEARGEAMALLERAVRIAPDAPEQMKRRAAGLYVALRELCREQDLHAVTVKCQYEFSKEYGMTPCLPLSLLADHGVVTSCEGDVPCLVSTAMLHYLSGGVASYGDAIHHEGNVLKLSPCGFMPFSLGNEGEARAVVSDYPFFKGLLCSFVMRPGRVTMLRLVEDVGDFHLLYFTGTGLPSELRGGNMPCLDVALDGDIDKLVARYPGQHFAICYGDYAEEIRMLAGMLGIRAERV